MLKRFVGFIWLILLLLAAFVGAWVVVDNDQQVNLHLFGYIVQVHSLGLLVLSAFSTGLLIGLLGNLVMTSWMTLKLRRLQKRLEQKEGGGKTAGGVHVGKSA